MQGDLAQQPFRIPQCTASNTTGPSFVPLSPTVSIGALVTAPDQPMDADNAPTAPSEYVHSMPAR